MRRLTFLYRLLSGRRWTGFLFIVAALIGLYVKARDRPFIVMSGIVLLGLLPSIYVAVRESARGAAPRS